MKESFQIFSLSPPPPSDPLRSHCFSKDERRAQRKCSRILLLAPLISYPQLKMQGSPLIIACFFFSPPVWSSTLHGCRLCSLCIWLHKHNQYGRGELFYDWRSCCVFGGEIHYLVSEPSAIQYHLFIKSLFARRKWIQLQQRERGRGRGGERESERREDGERWREIKGTCVYEGGWIDL